MKDTNNFAECVKFFLKVIIHIFYKIEYVNREKFPKEGPIILCANHVSAIDMFFVACSLKRLVHYMAKEELFRTKLSGWFFRKMGAFPVRRGKSDLETIRKSLSILREGKVLGIYPEGRRVGNVRVENTDLKPGAALFADKSGAFILPVRVLGDFKLFSRVKIIYGEPYKLEEKEKRRTHDELVAETKNIMDKIYSLVG